MPRALSAMLGLAVFANSVEAGAAGSFAVAPPPVWVEEAAVPEPALGGASPAASGVEYLLLDHQVRAGGTREVHYNREVKRVLSTTDVQGASELKLDFDPSHERLTLHYARLWRGGRSIDAFDAKDVKLVQREEELEARIYDGTLSALVFLRDVRAGDVIDYAYSIEGRDPVLAGGYVETLALAYDVAVQRVRHRLLWESTAPLHVKSFETAPAPKLASFALGTSYLWDMDRVPAVETAGDTPGWFDPHPAVQVGTFATWQDVVRWALPLYRTEGRARSLEPLLARWRAEHASEAQRALAAIRFVQDEVRYLGVETGVSSHRPHAPEQVLAQRYGDCKDKSLLLVTALAGLGIQAWPALVNTAAGRALDEWLPSPFAFDHVVVHARIEGEPVWIDATVAGQGGGLEQLRTLSFERALLVQQGSSALTPLPAPATGAATTHVAETYVVREGEPTTLDVSTTYVGADAEEMRAHVATTGSAELAKGLLNRYAREDPSTTVATPHSVEDDRAANHLVVNESYTIAQFWRGEQRSFTPWALAYHLDPPESPVRTAPLSFPHPVEVLHTIRIVLPAAWKGRTDGFEVASPAFRFRHESAVSGSEIRLSYRYVSTADTVAPEAMARHVSDLERARQRLSYTLGQHDRRFLGGLTGSLRGRESLLLLLGWLGLIGVLTLLARARARTRRVPAAETTPVEQGAGDTATEGVSGESRLLPGEAPATAYTFDRVEDAAVILDQEYCGGCRTLLKDAPGEHHTFSYDLQPMTVLTRQCGVCGRQRSLYFALGPSTNVPAS